MRRHALFERVQEQKLRYGLAELFLAGRFLYIGTWLPTLYLFLIVFVASTFANKLSGDNRGQQQKIHHSKKKKKKPSHPSVDRRELSDVACAR